MNRKCNPCVKPLQDNRRAQRLVIAIVLTRFGWDITHFLTAVSDTCSAIFVDDNQWYLRMTSADAQFNPSNRFFVSALQLHPGRAWPSGQPLCHCKSARSALQASLPQALSRKQTPAEHCLCLSIRFWRKGKLRIAVQVRKGAIALYLRTLGQHSVVFD
jgi:hypothetical protein